MLSITRKRNDRLLSLRIRKQNRHETPFLINKPQHPLRFINLIRQNTVAQHHSESVSSAKNKRRQILCANKAAGYNSEPEKSSPVPEHISFFRLFPVIQQSADALLLFVKTGVSIVSTDTSSAKSIFIDVISQNFKR